MFQGCNIIINVNIETRLGTVSGTIFYIADASITKIFLFLKQTSISFFLYSHFEGHLLSWTQSVHGRPLSSFHSDLSYIKITEEKSTRKVLDGWAADHRHHYRHLVSSSHLLPTW